MIPGIGDTGLLQTPWGVAHRSQYDQLYNDFTSGGNNLEATLRKWDPTNAVLNGGMQVGASVPQDQPGQPAPSSKPAPSMSPLTQAGGMDVRMGAKGLGVDYTGAGDLTGAYAPPPKPFQPAAEPAGQITQDANARLVEQEEEDERERDAAERAADQATAAAESVSEAGAVDSVPGGHAESAVADVSSPGGGDGGASGGDGGGSGDGGGAGDGGGGSAGDSGGPGAFRHGGKVQQGEQSAQPRRRGQRPDPAKLSEMLKKGGTVKVGDHDDRTDDIPVVLTRNEVVLNPPAAKEFGPILERMNEWGRRRMGGMGVGPAPADGGLSRSTGRGGHAGGFGVTGRPRDERR